MLNAERRTGNCRKTANDRFNVHRSTGTVHQSGFTLIEVILVMVVIAIVGGISLPHLSSALRGTQLTSSARTINRLANYARSMSILREQTLTIALNPETMEIFIGAPSVSTNTADGELDMAVIKRLYKDGDDADNTAGLEKEVRRFLPDDLSVYDFEKEWTEEDDRYENLYLIRYFPNGQSEWFLLELEDQRGTRVKLENDPVSGKIRAEFSQ